MTNHEKIEGNEMGMDVYSIEPKNDQGKYFQANISGWGELADYVWEIAPEIAQRCPRWITNDGYGMNDRDSVKLADALQAEIDSGRIAGYADGHGLENGASPAVRYFIQRVKEFVVFLRGCGGFEIF